MTSSTSLVGITSQRDFWNFCLVACGQRIWQNMGTSLQAEHTVAYFAENIDSRRIDFYRQEKWSGFAETSPSQWWRRPIILFELRAFDLRWICSVDFDRRMIIAISCLVSIILFLCNGSRFRLGSVEKIQFFDGFFLLGGILMDIFLLDFRPRPLGARVKGIQSARQLLFFAVTSLMIFCHSRVVLAYMSYKHLDYCGRDLRSFVPTGRRRWRVRGW